MPVTIAFPKVEVDQPARIPEEIESCLKDCDRLVASIEETLTVVAVRARSYESAFQDILSQFQDRA